MSTPSYTVPSQPITLNLPQPTVGGSVVWSESPALGSVAPSNDGQSALFTPGATVYTLTKALKNAATGGLALTSVAASSGGTAVYTGTITGGAANALVGNVFTVAGFTTNPANNGVFICTASTALLLTLSNPAATVEALATATATSVATNVGFLGTIPGGAGNALVGDTIVVAGFVTSPLNNSTYTVIASSATSIGAVLNAGAITETHTATATTSNVTNVEVTAVITPAVASWQPGKFYRVGEQVAALGHLQRVTAGTKSVQVVYTPNAGFIPGSASLALAGGSATSTGNTVAITSITAAVPSSFAVGQVVRISSATSTSLNGTWTLTVVGTHNISFSYTGVALSGASQAAGTAYVAGDASTADEDYTGSSYGIGANAQYGTVLNSDGGGANGDWPAGAIAANSGNLKTPYPTSAASVTWVSGGFSGGPHAYAAIGTGLTPTFDGPQQGVDTPTSYGNDTRAQFATYSEIGPDGYKSYYDAAGNLITNGWQVAKGTVDFAEPLSLTAPIFSIIGGVVTDGDLAWTDEGAISTVTYNANLTVSATAPAPLGYYVTLG